MPNKRGREKAKVTKQICTIGIDLGGTKVAAALVDPDGKVLAETSRPTVPPEMENQDPRKASGPANPAQVKKHIEYVVNAMAEAALETLEKGGVSSIKGVGLASAGPMNIEKGTLAYPSNFTGWKVVPLVEKFASALKRKGLNKPISFQNDAIAGALGEGWVGRARGCETYAMITVGTGIGTGVIFNGHPAQSGGMGSEWGHVLVDIFGIGNDPDSFNSRSVEGIASGTALVKRAKARGLMVERASELAKIAKTGDPIALELFHHASEALASLLYSLSLGFHPERFVISGGMIGIKELFLPQTVALYKELMKRKNPQFLAPVQIAKLGISAGVIGAARLPHLNKH